MGSSLNPIAALWCWHSHGRRFTTHQTLILQLGKKINRVNRSIQSRGNDTEVNIEQQVLKMPTNFV